MADAEAIQSKGPHRSIRATIKRADAEAILTTGPHRSIMATIKRAYADAILIKRPQREEEEGDSERERMQRLYRARARRGRRMSTMKRAETEAILIEGSIRHLTNHV